MADEIQSPTEEALTFDGDEDAAGLEGLDDIVTGGDESVTDADDPDLEAIKQRVKEMEEEAEKLKEMQNQVDKQMMSPKAAAGPAGHFPTPEEKQEADDRSIYVGNVDYGATAEELEQHFHGCGAINRVTIICDKITGHPKGFAYIEFTDKDSVDSATALDETLFRARQIKVSRKRTNLPGFMTGRGRGRFRGGGGGVRYRMVPVYGGGGGYGGAGYSPYAGGYAPRGFGRGRFRSRRGTNWYSPY